MKELYLEQITNLCEQYKKLLIKSLQILRFDTSKTPSFIVLIDALNKCENKNNIKTVLQLLANAKNLAFLDFCIFITNCFEGSIRLDFQAIFNIFVRSLALHDIPCLVVNQNIKFFVKYQLMQIQRERRLSIN